MSAPTHHQQRLSILNLASVGQVTKHTGIAPRQRPTDSSALFLRPFGVGFTASFQIDVPSGCSLMAAYTASTAPTAQSSAQHAEESQIKSVHPMFPQLDVQSVSATGGQDSGKYLHGACSIKLVGQAKARLRSLENVCPGGAWSLLVDASP